MAPLGPFPADRRVMAAVSGGADSMALALLLSRWGQPLACVVDHGLRAESASEAALTVQRLNQLGVPSRIVGANLARGSAVAERARAARYALLFAACRETGYGDLLLGHHAADQAETVRMRQDAGSAGAGLAGMAAVSYRNEARLLRPLLPVRPERLRATLREAGVPWVEDPSNQDLRTPRARLRVVADRDSQAVALDIASRCGPERRCLERRIAAELGAVRLHPEGYAVVPGPLSAAALSALIWTISGRLYPPPRAALAAGLASRTVHGVLLRDAGRLGRGVLLAREPHAVAPPEPAAAGLLWDGRFRLGRAPLPPGLELGALGDDASHFRDRSALPSSVLRTLPALRRQRELAAVPHLHFPDGETCRSFMVWFCPARPAAGAPFVPALG